MERQFTIYRITGPTGKTYIGLTSLTLNERWRQHVQHSITAPKDHPFYADIRYYGSTSFTVEAITNRKGIHNARRAEQVFIDQVTQERRYNLSPGGSEDARFGGLLFWERLNTNPDAKQAFLQKLSESKTERDWSDYESMGQAAENWRREHPKEAYKLSYRAIRIARKKNGAATPVEDTRPLKERLMWKHKRGEMTRKNALALWASRTDAERAEVAAKISAAQKCRMREIAILPDFQQDDWPFAKATILRKIRAGFTRDDIIADAINTIQNRGSHWRDVQKKIQVMREVGNL